MTAEYRLFAGWRAGDTQTLPALRTCYTYNDRWPDRATGWLYGADQPWPEALADLGPWLLADLQRDTGITFTAACFQAYRNGTGCDWHHDRDWGAQAILSLGVTRRFGLRRNDWTVSEDYLRLAHGDLLVMPAGFQDSWEHCVPVEDAPGERCSIVFRSRN